jgi:hypothetical protein
MQVGDFAYVINKCSYLEKEFDYTFSIQSRQNISLGETSSTRLSKDSSK